MSKSMIQRLAQDPNDSQALQELEQAVAKAGQTGYGAQGDNLIDWLSNGDYDGTETVDDIAAEWDADQE